MSTANSAAAHLPWLGHEDRRSQEDRSLRGPGGGRGTGMLPGPGPLAVQASASYSVPGVPSIVPMPAQPRCSDSCLFCPSCSGRWVLRLPGTARRQAAVPLLLARAPVGASLPFPVAYALYLSLGWSPLPPKPRAPHVGLLPFPPCTPTPALALIQSRCSVVTWPETFPLPGSLVVVFVTVTNGGGAAGEPAGRGQEERVLAAPLLCDPM